MRCFRATACMLLAAGLSWATDPDERGAWLMMNYRFTGPPPPRMVSAGDAAVSELRQVQAALGSILRRANLDEDYFSALSATAQMAINAVQLGAMTASPPAAPTVQAPQYDAPPSGFGLRQPASWSDDLMVHYITPQGTHVQIRKELVGQPLQRNGRQ